MRSSRSTSRVCARAGRADMRRMSDGSQSKGPQIFIGAFMGGSLDVANANSPAGILRPGRDQEIIPHCKQCPLDSLAAVGLWKVAAVDSVTHREACLMLRHFFLWM